MSHHRATISDSGKVDAELIERCRKGDADAWDTLFDKYYPVAARFVFQRFELTRERDPLSCVTRTDFFDGLQTGCHTER